MSHLIPQQLLTRSGLGIAAGVCGSMFLAYCVYFDHKRRSHPAFRQKLREKRLKERKQQKSSKLDSSQLPDLKDYEAVQKFFMQEVQLGEELLGLGDVDNGVEHLSNAVAVCGQPQQLLQVLQQTLPPQVFALLLQRLPIASQRLARTAAETSGGMSASMVEDDVE